MVMIDSCGTVHYTLFGFTHIDFQDKVSGWKYFVLLTFYKEKHLWMPIIILALKPHAGDMILVSISIVVNYKC